MSPAAAGGPADRAMTAATPPGLDSEEWVLSSLHHDENNSLLHAHSEPTIHTQTARSSFMRGTCASGARGKMQQRACAVRGVACSDAATSDSDSSSDEIDVFEVMRLNSSMAREAPADTADADSTIDGDVDDRNPRVVGGAGRRGSACPSELHLTDNEDAVPCAPLMAPRELAADDALSLTAGRSVLFSDGHAASSRRLYGSAALLREVRKDSCPLSSNSLFSEWTPKLQAMQCDAPSPSTILSARPAPPRRASRVMRSPNGRLMFSPADPYPNLEKSGAFGDMTPVWVAMSHVSQNSMMALASECCGDRDESINTPVFALPVMEAYARRETNSSSSNGNNNTNKPASTHEPPSPLRLQPHVTEASSGHLQQRDAGGDGNAANTIAEAMLRADGMMWSELDTNVYLAMEGVRQQPQQRNLRSPGSPPPPRPQGPPPRGGEKGIPAPSVVLAGVAAGTSNPTATPTGTPDAGRPSQTLAGRIAQGCEEALREALALAQQAQGAEHPHLPGGGEATPRRGMLVVLPESTAPDADPSAGAVRMLMRPVRVAGGDGDTPAAAAPVAPRPPSGAAPSHPARGRGCVAGGQTSTPSRRLHSSSVILSHPAAGSAVRAVAKTGARPPPAPAPSILARAVSASSVRLPGDEHPQDDTVGATTTEATSLQLSDSYARQFTVTVSLGSNEGDVHHSVVNSASSAVAATLDESTLSAGSASPDPYADSACARHQSSSTCVGGAPVLHALKPQMSLSTMAEDHLFARHESGVQVLHDMTRAVGGGGHWGGDMETSATDSMGLEPEESSPPVFLWGSCGGGVRRHTMLRQHQQQQCNAAERAGGGAATPGFRPNFLGAVSSTATLPSSTPPQTPVRAGRGASASPHQYVRESQAPGRAGGEDSGILTAATPPFLTGQDATGDYFLDTFGSETMSAVGMLGDC